MRASPAADGVQRRRDGALVHPGGDHRRRVAAEQQPAVLVGHQRDQRRDDHRQVRRRDAGQLVAEALAAAGGHHHEAVAPVERRLHRLALPGAELAEAEVPQQRVRVARPVVGPLRRRLDGDPVEALQRELRVAVIRGGRRRAWASASVRAAASPRRGRDRRASATGPQLSSSASAGWPDRSRCGRPAPAPWPEVWCHQRQPTDREDLRPTRRAAGAGRRSASARGPILRRSAPPSGSPPRRAPRRRGGSAGRSGPRGPPRRRPHGPLRAGAGGGGASRACAIRA